MALGCYRTDTNKPDDEVVASLKKEVTTLNQALREKRVEVKRLLLDVGELGQKLTEQQEAGKDTTAIKDLLAPKQVELETAMKGPVEQLSNLETKFSELQAAKKEPEPEAPKPTIPSEGLVDWVEQPENDPDPIDPTETPTAEPDSVKSEMNGAMNELLKFGAAAICLYNPALAPLIGILGDALGLFDSTEDQQNLLGALTDVATGKGLSADQQKFLTEKVVPKVGDFPPGALGVIGDLLGPESSVGKVVEDRLERIAQDHPQVRALISLAQDGKVSEAVLQVFPENKYPSAKVKDLVLTFAAKAKLSISKVQALRDIPVR